MIVVFVFVFVVVSNYELVNNTEKYIDTNNITNPTTHPQ